MEAGETPHQLTQGPGEGMPGELPTNKHRPSHRRKGIEIFPGWRKEFLDVKHLQASPTHAEQASGQENPLEAKCQDGL